MQFEFLKELFILNFCIRKSLVNLNSCVSIMREYKITRNGKLRERKNSRLQKKYDYSKVQDYEIARIQITIIYD